MRTEGSVSSFDHEFALLAQDLLDNTPSVIYAKDLNFRYLFINHQFENLFHVDRNSSLGKTDFDVFAPDLAERFRANDRIVLETGRSLHCEEVAPHDDGPHQYFSVKFPLKNKCGEIYGIAGISTDMTSQLRAEREIASLEYRQHLILDSVADGICGLDSSGKIAFLNPAAERMLELTTEDLKGKCHSHVVLPRKFDGYLHREIEPYPVKAVLNGETAMNVPNATFRCREGRLLPVEYTVAPIRYAGETLGAVVAFRDSTARLKQIEIEQEIQTALRVQMSLYPKKMPEIPGFDFAAICIPCSKASGDYFDFIPWGENRLGVAVGDVSGHGLAPALEMVATRALLRATMQNEAEPAACLERLNQILVEDLPDEMFVTLFLLSLNTVEKTLSYAAAGHDALFLAANGDLRRLKSTGTVLGLNPVARFSAGDVVSMQAGDVLLIATDGLAESMSPARELFGINRIVQTLRQHQFESTQQIVMALQRECERFRQHEASRDDITAVAIKAL